MEILHFLQYLINSQWKSFSFNLIQISCVAAWSCFLFCFHCVLPKRKWFHLVHVIPLKSSMITKFFISFLLLWMNKPNPLSFSSHTVFFSPLTILVTLHCTWSSISMSFLYRGAHNWTQYSRFGVTGAKGSHRIPCSRCRLDFTRP